MMSLISASWCLLHLSLMLLRFEPTIIRNLEGQEKKILSWKQENWERKLDLSHMLLSYAYETLATTLSYYKQFTNTPLDAKVIQSQQKALMVRVRTLAGTNKEIPNLPILKFDAAANIVILCASVGVFAICPKLHNLKLIDSKNYASQLRKSPLYQLEWITTDKVKEELEIINYGLFLPKKLQDYVIALQGMGSKVLNHMERTLHEMLKAGLRVIAGELASILLKSNEFTVFANIMIICACLGVYAMDLQGDKDIHHYMNFEAHAAQLHLSPLYKSVKITSEKAQTKFDCIILFQPKEDC
ncbi:hypothetical protein CIRG_09903 [Coccidioides immitis RMSCC 2394]|uniref:Uncharacterized protein n=1 Tax=Coccidioides immitis RMSCC 2394 TaxID=404692 RepID=A0A0J7BIN5_COCIT|nr:hypothetical protein CIRG_09903 [Coccidioides immitis RMSCC 2394]